MNYKLDQMFIYVNAYAFSQFGYLSEVKLKILLELPKNPQGLIMAFLISFYKHFLVLQGIIEHSQHLHQVLDLMEQSLQHFLLEEQLTYDEVFVQPN